MGLTESPASEIVVITNLDKEKKPFFLWILDDGKEPTAVQLNQCLVSDWLTCEIQTLVNIDFYGNRQTFRACKCIVK